LNFTTPPTLLVDAVRPIGTPNNSSLRFTNRQTYEGVKGICVSLPPLEKPTAGLHKGEKVAGR